MPTTVTSVTSHFPEAQNGFTTTTAALVSSAATTVSLNSVAGYTNGEPAVFVIDPTDATKKQTFTGIVNTAGNQITSVVWTAGTNQTHSLGATVVDYATATHVNMMSKGIKVSLNQDGTIKNGAVSTTAKLSDGIVTKAKQDTAAQLAIDTGWNLNTGTTTVPAPNTVTANGNRSYNMVFNSVNLTGYFNAGTRLRTTRTVAAPTQCTSLNGTTQYYSKATPNKMTFTDDFVISAWVKMTSYAVAAIVGKFDGTNGFQFYIESTGQVVFRGYNAASSNYRGLVSYQSIPLNKWVHITAQLDMSSGTATTTTNYVMIDGVDVPVATTANGTSPTALIQAGNLNIGASNGAAFFPGKIAQVAIYNAKVTQATILASMNQTLSGSETSLASAYSFNNSIADLNTTTPNDLTANAGVVATNADSPFGTQASGLISATLDYGIIQSATFSTNTTVVVQVPEGNTIPTSGGVSAVAYSGLKAPYGMPVQKDKWQLYVQNRDSTNNGTSGSFTNVGGKYMSIPIGNWYVTLSGTIESNHGSASSYYLTFSTSTTSETDTRFTIGEFNGGALHRISNYSIQSTLSLSSATTYYVIVKGTAGASVSSRGDFTPTQIQLENAYL